ncbi:hypothetical protein Aab01nite_82810 [Paractinoplanes abujensis]|uniref:Uncharacterized protein n=1 Tax=Paractinoplanes abujensis TaxID=882441 RepID=A0A7W7FZB2_9ACTN|nr:hypothetical protein [Actinoplanes abujensis]MBB4689905.1 hypothetical protein [Actinoplanes abujensis]GID24691.1 hypothetical protein Aab01nite_82810 [Actinoplanes abujensis]
MTRPLKALLFGLLGATLLSAATITGAVAFASKGVATTPAAAPSFDPITPAATTTAPTVSPTLSLADLDLTPKVVKNQCFGSAGCSVLVKVEMGYGGTPLILDETWEVTYELTGDETGPIIGTFELAGSRYDQDEIHLSTRSSKP